MMFLIGAPHTCPVCTDFRFKRSTQGWFRHVAILFGFVPFRCMHCQNRVWRIAPFTKVPTKRKKGIGAVAPSPEVTPSTPTPAEGIEKPTIPDPVPNEERRG
jgi:hypothetical protein